MLCGRDSYQLLRVLHQSERFQNQETLSITWPEILMGTPIPPHELRRKIDYLLEFTKEDTSVVLCTQSEIVLLAVRVAIHQGKIAPDRVEVLWFADHCNDSEEIKITIDRNGRLPSHPYGFFDIQETMLVELLTPREG